MDPSILITLTPAEFNDVYKRIRIIHFNNAWLDENPRPRKLKKEINAQYEVVNTHKRKR